MDSKILYQLTNLGRDVDSKFPKPKRGRKKKIHGSQLRAFSREHSTQPLPRRQGSDRNKLHGARSLFKFLLLKI